MRGLEIVDPEGAGESTLYPDHSFPSDADRQDPQAVPSEELIAPALEITRPFSRARGIGILED